jgi:hypothetical protein
MRESLAAKAPAHRYQSNNDESRWAMMKYQQGGTREEDKRKWRTDGGDGMLKVS